MDIDEKVSALYKIRRLDKEEYVLIFENIIQELFTDPKPEYVIKLCAVFYDDVYFYEVMYGLIHAVEALAKGENYSYLISLGICNMTEGRDWSKVFLYGILNTKDEFMKYPEVLRQLSEEQRRHIVGILQEIKDDDEEIFGERISWIMSEING